MIEIIIISLVSFIILFIFAYYISSQGKKSFHFKLTSNLALIAQIFIPLCMFLTLQVFIIQLGVLSRNSTFEVIDRSWLAVNEKIKTEYNECPNLINSLYFDWQLKKLGDIDNQIKRKDRWYSVNYISNLIFQSWEDFITASSSDQTGTYVWMNNFLQWTNSEILKESWSVLKGNYSNTTQEFGDYLFHISSISNPKNTLELYNLAEKVSKSNEIKLIFKKRFNKLF